MSDSVNPAASPSDISVTVPATTANLGPGFDCLGAALPLYNRFQFRLTPNQPLKITATGLNAERVTTDERNLAYQAFNHFYQQLGQQPPSVHLAIQLAVPLARGLGSSATAIIGGLVGANCLAGSPLAQSEIMALAIALEGHPDNVVPALLGGCQLTTRRIDESWLVCDLPWHPNLVSVVAIPDFELSTSEARRVLPRYYERQDAIFNAAHLGLLLRALQVGEPDWLEAALQDRIHQPFRQPLIAGFEAVQAAALAAGAYGLVISGAGPSLLALANISKADQVQSAMQLAWQNLGIQAEAHILPLESCGATVHSTHPA
ncbi:MAG: homoserine kinase [Pegethrix bostrychoides GSE-TBD4-15B]|jgi:homoserine kinase|uniref:Homoserine kinase n=1 Tax=Pegethrix bostrychoides GSE-TBD4-15B TaxID=2839662 RepID=A0A951U4R1_9CYAN|nr:homoserine kinase [Pegethrix bostrychoides GSE-TBD4-15B]